ncbi:hypothetical protein [Fodinibius sediminis]|uniref:Uncharacterized protein n=1 Tax=Fodinibius sediminis TaxID=1214077 RepID=A0A521BGM6_9BACT|nr:hypothetical protein [Fodinibius sediminis]SMO46258.1 hypothetical protein SAMN06265218_10398 [Fodinibius sediminis]
MEANSGDNTVPAIPLVEYLPLVGQPGSGYLVTATGALASDDLVIPPVDRSFHLSRVNILKYHSFFHRYDF